MAYPDARTLLTEIDLSNPQNKLLPRNYVTASIKVSKQDVWTLPATAVTKQGENSFCYRVQNSRTVRTPVSVGLSDGQWIEVVQLQQKPARPNEEAVWVNPTGEETVIENAASVTDGQTVTGPGAS